VLFGELDDRLHPAGMAAVVEHDDRPRRRRDRSLDVLDVQIQVVRALDVAEDGRRADVDDGVRRGDEVQRRDDDLVARGATDGKKRHVQRRSAVRDCEGVLRVAELCERRLELHHARPHAPPAGADSFGDRLLDLLVDDEVRERPPPREAGLLLEPLRFLDAAHSGSVLLRRSMMFLAPGE